MKDKIILNAEYIDNHNNFLLDVAPLNYLFGKDVFFTSGFGNNKSILFQMIGNLGAFANDYELHNLINVFIISDSLFEQLKTGLKDETLIVLEKKLNLKGQPFKDLLIISESALVTFVRKRTSFYSDEATRKLINLNLEEIDSFIALDFETANSSHSSACEIGLVKVVNGKVVDKFYSLIKPPDNNYFKVNTLIHGITPEQTQESPCFNIIWPRIKDFIGNNLIVAHNITTDLSILRQTLEFYSIQIPNYKSSCTYRIFGASLSDTCQAYGIDRQYHNALIDAEACALIYINYLNNIKPDFSKASTTKRLNLFDFTGHDRIQGDCLKPDFENGDSSCPFYKKKVVITGVFSKISRQEIASILKEKGADLDTSITDRTNYLISGLDPGPTKIRKFESLKKAGFDINIVSETDFLEMTKCSNKTITIDHTHPDF